MRTNLWLWPFIRIYANSSSFSITLSTHSHSHVFYLMYEIVSKWIKWFKCMQRKIYTYNCNIVSLSIYTFIILYVVHWRETNVQNWNKWNAKWNMYNTICVHFYTVDNGSRPIHLCTFKCKTHLTILSNTITERKQKYDKFLRNVLNTTVLQWLFKYSIQSIRMMRDTTHRRASVINSDQCVNDDVKICVKRFSNAARISV